MQVAIVSDTHVPSRAPRIPEWVCDRLASADHVLHAGDFDTPDAARRVSELAGPDGLTAVRGNTDRPGVDFPRVATADLGGVTFVVTHGDGPPRNYRRRVARTVLDRVGADEPGADAVGVCGHTHERLDERVAGVRLLNPGTATGASPGTEASMLVAEVDDGSLSVAVHRRD